MAYYATKTSALLGAVPTDGVMYYTGNNVWSNEPEDKVLFDTEEAATAELQVERPGLGFRVPAGIQIISE